MRINVTLSDANYEELKDSAKLAEIDMSEFVRNSLRVFKYLLKEGREGNSIYIGKDNKITKEIVVF